VQRQKRKYVTVVAGLETVPELKVKDAAKFLGKRFASGATVNEDSRGQKEVVIQGDVMFEMPEVLMAEFKVSKSCIYFLEDGAIRNVV
jgi:density-regulated protein DRP1